jgi:hypothetical protein
VFKKSDTIFCFYLFTTSCVPSSFFCSGDKSYFLFYIGSQKFWNWKSFDLRGILYKVKSFLWVTGGWSTVHKKHGQEEGFRGRQVSAGELIIPFADGVL